MVGCRGRFWWYRERCRIIFAAFGWWDCWLRRRRIDAIASLHSDKLLTITAFGWVGMNHHNRLTRMYEKIIPQSVCVKKDSPRQVVGVGNTDSEKLIRIDEWVTVYSITEKLKLNKLKARKTEIGLPNWFFNGLTGQSSPAGGPSITKNNSINQFRCEYMTMIYRYPHQNHIGMSLHRLHWRWQILHYSNFPDDSVSRRSTV